ncbi:MAG TPA: hypothetical protein VGV35_01575, partial [Bryobacteraceae bacterium]|nr:hypothetical protein [Bryobacteraceae bacterium]
AQLLGFYSGPGSQSPPTGIRTDSRRRHLLWLVDHHPDSALLSLPEAAVNPSGQPLGDAEGYELLKKAWLDAAAKKDVNTITLSNAARFFLLPDKALAAEFYGRARKLDPGNPAWMNAQASMMAFALVGITSVNQNGLPDPADPKEAASEGARSVGRDLEASKDGELLIAVAGELMGRGAMAQAMARSKTGVKPAVDALALAESYLQRADKLDPGKNAIHLGLARIYELRWMSAETEEDKKTLARARYEQLQRGMSGLHEDDPASSAQVLNLARAAMDAGELERAETLAKGLLALTPKIEVDPKLSRGVDDMRHHSFLILGRVALRRGDVDAAKADLLDAGRVGSGVMLASLGPNMMLAKELLEKGEKDVVLQYIGLCRRFWYFADRMTPWIVAIAKGEMPNFGDKLYH